MHDASLLGFFVYCPFTAACGYCALTGHCPAWRSGCLQAGKCAWLPAATFYMHVHLSEATTYWPPEKPSPCTKQSTANADAGTYACVLTVVRATDPKTSHDIPPAAFLVACCCSWWLSNMCAPPDSSSSTSTFGPMLPHWNHTGVIHHGAPLERAHHLQARMRRSLS
jgi:hypothetical protein